MSKRKTVYFSFTTAEAPEDEAPEAPDDAFVDEIAAPLYAEQESGETAGSEASSVPEVSSADEPVAVEMASAQTMHVEPPVAEAPPPHPPSPTRKRVAAKKDRPHSTASREQRQPLGYVTYDYAGDQPANGSCAVVVLPEHAHAFRRDIYVGVRDEEQDVEFLGRVIQGPFYRPDDTAASQASEEQAYQIHGTVELLGVLTEGERLLPTPTRPRPHAQIYVFPNSRLHRFFGLDGDFHVGHLVGHEQVHVHAHSESKNFLPRNVGIFGTVGSGKSNTAQVIAEEAVAAGWAVLLIDVEGEYVRMNTPSTDETLGKTLQDLYGREPRGLDNFRVYVPSSGRSATAASTPFKVPISALFPEIVGDILEFTEAETRVFNMITAQATRVNATGDDDESDIYRPHRPYTLQHLLDGLIESSSMNGPGNVRLLPMANAQDVATASLLRSKLRHLARSDMFDWRETEHISELPILDVLSGGRMSVLDVSETDDRSRNIAITYILQELFRYVTETPVGQRLPGGRPRPPVLVIIEEVHTFVSRASAAKMRAVLDMLQIISRRGRKRWMALALVSQQPNHVPDEVFELTNTRFVHQIKSPVNLGLVKRTTAGVDEAMWSSVTTLGPGQCLVTGPVFLKPMLVTVRPAASCRLHAS